MKKRILFVDDEPMVLQGIQRSLRSMREEWDIDFAEGGEEAQEYLAREAYDVVLTDMMMPGMDGSQLLALVKERAPETVRLVLSGHAEPGLAMKCIGLAHQCLSKPCEGAILRATISRLTDRKFALRNEQVMAIVGRLENLPSVPTTYSRMVRLMDDPDTSMDQLGALIAQDMAMTAKILQLVNSSFFGLPRRIVNPAEAASFLGLNTLKAVILAASIFGQFELRLPAGFSPSNAVAHSQRVATAAREIARSEKATSRVVDEALVAGLLHDVGKLVLASNLPGEFQRVVEIGELNLLDAEESIFGTTHAEVGGYLLGLWGLPGSIVEAARLHHRPAESEECEFSALTATHVANALVQEGERMPLDMDYLDHLGVAHRLPAWREALEALSESSAHNN
jgi:HD-like signal output (HDOD) protein/CheY-like chemotaxis protein